MDGGRHTVELTLASPHPPYCKDNLASVPALTAHTQSSWELASSCQARGLFGSS